MSLFDSLRKDFPILETQIYLDNAATTQKPLSVLEAIENYNKTMHSNPHRGAYKSSILATEAFENVRTIVQNFIGANRFEEIIFTKGTTESINLVARTFGISSINAGDEIVLTIAEHHSNLIPWQWVAKTKGAKLKYVYVNQDGRLNLDDFCEIINEKTKLVCVTHISNVIGAINPIKEIAQIAHSKGAKILVDGAQSIAHMPINVVEMDVDFFVFSGHKVFAPTGIGVLYGKFDILNEMPPYLFGGNMIEYVTEQETTYAPLPNKFEAGTQNVEGVVGLGAALKYIQNIGLDKIESYEKDLTSYALSKMKEIDFVNIIGPTESENRSSVISFTVEDVHPHDVATILDSEGISVRSGNHCAHPLIKYLQLSATSRVSFAFYNNYADIDKFIEKLKTVREWLGYGS